MAFVTESMKSDGSKRSNQGDVWNNISSKFRQFESSSPTSAMSDLYQQQSVRIEDYVHSLTPIANQIGAVFGLDGEVIGLELFDSADTFRKLFPKIIRSYGLDALASRKGERADGPVPSKAQVAAFLKRVADAKVAEFAGVGEGQDLRLEAEGLTGAALEVDDRVVHLSAFRMGSIRN
jgi:hypothetical protein